MYCGYGLHCGIFLTRYATIDATNIVGITINAVIKLAIMGGVYVVGLVLFRQYKYFIEIIHIKKVPKIKKEPLTLFLLQLATKCAILIRNNN